MNLIWKHPTNNICFWSQADNIIGFCFPYVKWPFWRTGCSSKRHPCVKTSILRTECNRYVYLPLSLYGQPYVWPVKHTWIFECEDWKVRGKPASFLVCALQSFWTRKQCLFAARPPPYNGSALFSTLGMVCGTAIGRKFGQKSKFAAGIVLVTIGIRIILQ